MSCVAGLHSEPCSDREVADFVLRTRGVVQARWLFIVVRRCRGLGGGQHSGQDLHLSGCGFPRQRASFSCESWRRAGRRVSGRATRGGLQARSSIRVRDSRREFVCACVGALVTLLPGRAQWHSGSSHRRCCVRRASSGSGFGLDRTRLANKPCRAPDPRSALSDLGDGLPPMALEVGSPTP